jgi:hypothetical protein
VNRRARALIVFGTASVACLGSFEAASAITSNSPVSATQAIKACATSGGSLRIAKASGKCPSGTTRVGLARPATAPKAMALDITSGTHSKSLSLLANTKLTALCGLNSNGLVIAQLKVVRAGQTQIDGTSFLVNSGLSGVDFVTANGANETPTGASSVYSAIAGGFSASAGGSGSYATLNAHLLVTVPGAVFTIDAIVDANADTPYCRISAEVESATT